MRNKKEKERYMSLFFAKINNLFTQIKYDEFLSHKVEQSEHNKLQALVIANNKEYS